MSYLLAATAEGVIDQTINANMTAIVVLSMVFTPIILILYEKLMPKPKTDDIQPDEIDEQHPILILGMGRFGQIVECIYCRLSGYDTPS